MGTSMPCSDLLGRAYIMKGRVPAVRTARQTVLVSGRCSDPWVVEMTAKMLEAELRAKVLQHSGKALSHLMAGMDNLISVTLLFPKQPASPLSSSEQQQQKPVKQATRKAHFP